MEDTETTDVDKVKVTVSCRIPKGVKQDLEDQAKDNKSKSFAQYLEDILTTHSNNKATDIENSPEKEFDVDLIESRLTLIMEEQISPVLEKIEELKEINSAEHATHIHKASEQTAEVTTDSTLLSDENKELKAELENIAGNKDLQKLFKAYKGKSLEYKTPTGEVKSIEVESIADVITALVETVFDKK